MIEIRKTDYFAKWIDGLQDIRARARILVRIERLKAGNPGDIKPVGEGVRNYGLITAPVIVCILKKLGQKVIILLAGGDKKTQPKDIKTALSLSRNL